MKIDILKDRNGKNSMKRTLGAAGTIVALIMAISKPFINIEMEWSDTLILGILTASLGAIAAEAFAGSRALNSQKREFSDGCPTCHGNSFGNKRDSSDDALDNI
jgi:hypothetical protein